MKIPNSAPALSVHGSSSPFNLYAATSNLALNKPAYQSSTYKHAKAARAVDGRSNWTKEFRTSSRTTKQMNPWWAVDLGFEHLVIHVQISNRIRVCKLHYY